MLRKARGEGSGVKRNLTGEYRACRSECGAVRAPGEPVVGVCVTAGRVRTHRAVVRPPWSCGLGCVWGPVGYVCEPIGCVCARLQAYVQPVERRDTV